MRRKIEVVLSDECLATSSGLCMVDRRREKATLMKTNKHYKNRDILLAVIGMPILVM